METDLALQLGVGELEDRDVAKGVEGVQEVQLKQLRHSTPHAASLPNKLESVWRCCNAKTTATAKWNLIWCCLGYFVDCNMHLFLPSRPPSVHSIEETLS